MMDILPDAPDVIVPVPPRPLQQPHPHRQGCDTFTVNPVPRTNACGAVSDVRESTARRGRSLGRLPNLHVWILVLAVALVAAVLVQWSESLSSSTSLSLDTPEVSPFRWLLKGDDSRSPHSQHKPIYDEAHPTLFPLSRSDQIGFFLATLGLMVAAGGGIGGGGILVPVYILVMGFTPKHAIPLSNVTVLGGAVANTILNARKRHPLADRPLVDWDLILVMEPLTIAGALLGAFLNKVLPELLLTVLLVLLLSVTAYTSLTKALKLYARESRAMAAAQGLVRVDGTKESELTVMARLEDQDDHDEAAEVLLENMERDDDDDESSSDDDMKSVELPASSLQAELDQLLEEERTTPMANISILVTMFIVVLTINVLKGGGAFPSPLGIRCGSRAFWIANLVMLAWIGIISVGIRAYLVRRFEQKRRLSFPYVEGDIRWDARATIVYPLVCCMAGFFAGMFGVGGGIVKGPLMLAMGVHPAVSSASSACMILFTSFTATTSFVVFGLLVWDYAYVCMAIGFVATFAGQVGLSYLMRRAQRNSYIAFSIGAVVLLSAFLMTIQSLLSMAAGEKHHSGGICGKGD